METNFLTYIVCSGQMFSLIVYIESLILGDFNCVYPRKYGE
jgi:hypothetical protein